MKVEKFREGSIRKVLEDWHKEGYILAAPDLGLYSWTMKARQGLRWYGRNVTPKEAAANFVAEEDFRIGW